MAPTEKIPEDPNVTSGASVSQYPANANVEVKPKLSQSVG